MHKCHFKKFICKFINLLQLPSSPSSGSDSFGPEQIRQFTFDYSYWFAEPVHPENCSQEKVFSTVITSDKWNVLRCFEFASQSFVLV